MAFKLAIGNKVDVPVKFKLMDGDKEKNYKFTLHCKRMSTKELTDAIEKRERSIKEILIDVTTGWEGQTLVLDENDKPAEFGEEAFNCMLNVAGVATVSFQAYVGECNAKSKN